MGVSRYRSVLALPGVSSAMAVLLVARVPMASAGVAMTLHVVSTLHRGYGAAGVLGAIVTVGAAAGAPAVGRAVDRYGLRPVVLGCGVFSMAFWFCAPTLSYPVLLVAAFPAGVLTLPAMSLSRQITAALVPDTQRRAAYSLDSIATELVFMVGPAGVVLAGTALSTGAALQLLGVSVLLSGAALWWLNPPVLAEHERSAARPPWRSWLNRPLLATLLTVFAALIVLAGAELAMIAELRRSGSGEWLGVAYVVICAASLAGGLVHGVMRRPLPEGVLALVLAACTVPVGLVGGGWWWVVLALVPSNFACAPALAATAERVSVLAPPAVRGLASGLQSSAMTLGIALGNPVAGAVIDGAGPSWAFAVVGALGVVLIVPALVFGGTRERVTVG